MSGPWQDFAPGSTGTAAPPAVGPWSDFAPPPPPPKPAPVSTNGSLARNAAAGFGQGVIDTASMAFDPINPLAIGSKLVNSAADLMGAKPVVPKYLESTSGLANEGLDQFSLSPESVQPHTWDERLAYNIGLGASAVALPGGEEGFLANAGRNLVTGAASGIGKDVAEEAAPDQYKSLAGLAGSIVAGMGANAIASIPTAIGRTFAASPNAAANLADFTAEGIPPLAGPVLGNKSLTTLETTLSKLPGGAGVYENAQNATREALENRLSTTANAFGPVTTPEQASTIIAKGAKAADTRFKNTQDKLYTDALQPVLNVKPRTLTSLENLGSEWFGELNAAPESLGPTTGSALDRLNGILRDTKNGTMTLDALRRIRTSIGRDLADPVLGGVSGAMQPYLRRMYGALSDDINSVATAADPSIAGKLAVADRYSRANYPVLERAQDLINGKEGGQIFNTLLTSGQGQGGGGALLRTIRRTLKPQEWDAVAGTVLGRLGYANPGAQGASGVGAAADTFSPASFMTNWSKLSPEAKQALFGGTRYKQLVPSLDRLVRITEKVRDFERSAAGSPTAERMTRGALLGSMATVAGTAAMRGDLVGAVRDPAAIFLGGYVAPKMAARLMTDPKFISWLANRAAAQNPAAIAKSNLALRSLATSSPVITEFLQTQHGRYRQNGTGVEYQAPGSDQWGPAP